jgi:two-component system, NtrC family, sensor kinase
LIVTFDHDWKVVAFNSEASRLFGKKAVNAKNKLNIDDLYIPELAKIFKDEAEKGQDRISTLWKETVFKTKEGKEFPVQFAINMLYENGEFIGTVNFFQDPLK